MAYFFLGPYFWQTKLVEANDPVLIDRTGNLTLGVTDPETLTVYIANNLSRDMRIKVLLHELGHCAIFSFGLIDDIHKMVKKKYWIEAEEWVCNFIADYGIAIFRGAYQALGNEVWTYIAQKLEVMF